MLEFSYHSEPSPHVYFPQLLPPHVYESITFPDIPMRARGRSGRDLFVDEPGYQEAIASPGFKELYATFTSAEFNTWVLSLFARDLERHHCRARAQDIRTVPYVETRAELNDRPEALDERADPNEVFNRFDFTIGGMDYTQYVHLDSPRRLVGGLLFFCDAQRDAIVGGEFTLYKDWLFGNDRLAHLPRPAKRIPLKANTGVLFLNCNRGFHGPSAIHSMRAPRRWIYYSISSRNRVWEAQRHHKRIVSWAACKALALLGVRTGGPAEPESKVVANQLA